MISHHFSRTFQPQKLHTPRNFLPTDRISTSHSHSTPLYLEIGAGKGMHALEFARTHPNANLIAVERTKEKFSAFKKQLLPTDDNLKAVHADVIAWSVSALPPKCLDGVFLLYPNPESNNANQRWLNMPFFEFLLSRLKPLAKVVLASNIEEYILESADMCENTWCLSCEKKILPTNIQRTHFETKYQQRLETCWQLVIEKPTNYQTRFDHWSADF